MKLLQQRIKRFLCYILILSTILINIPSTVYSLSEEEITDITLTGNSSIEFDTNKVYRISIEDFKNYLSQNINNYTEQNYFQYAFCLPNGLCVTGNLESSSDYLIFRFDNAIPGTYIINSEKAPTIKSGANNSAFIHITREKNIQEVEDSAVEYYEFTANKNHKISKQVLYDLYMASNHCLNKNSINSINDVTKISFKYNNYSAEVTDDGDYVIVNIDSIIPAVSYMFYDYYGNMNGDIKNGEMIFYICPLAECEDVTIYNSSEADYYNYYFSTNKIYRIDKENFFDVFMASNNCDSSTINVMNDVKEYSFSTYYSTNKLVGYEDPMDPGYLYFDFTKLPKAGIYSFDFDGYSGKKSTDDIEGKTYSAAEGTGIAINLGFYSFGYIPNEIIEEINNATPAGRYAGKVFNAETLYMLTDVLSYPNQVNELFDSKNNLLNFPDIRVVDINHQEYDLTEKCTHYHYLTESSASGYYESSLIYFGNEYSEYTYLYSKKGKYNGTEIDILYFGVEVPTVTVTYKDMVTNEIIHTQDISEGQNNPHYENDDYIGWYDAFNNKVDDTTFTSGVTLYGVPKTMEVKLKGAYGVEDDSTLILNNTYDINDINTFEYKVNRTDIFNEDDYPLFGTSFQYAIYVNNPIYNKYTLSSIINSYSNGLWISAVPKNLSINIYNNSNEEIDDTIYDNKLTLKYKSTGVNTKEVIDFNKNVEISTDKLIYIYEFDNDFMEKHPLIVGNHETNDKYEILNDINEPYIINYNNAINNKSYIGDINGNGPTCTEGSTDKYIVNAVMQSIYKDGKETYLKETATTLGYTYMTENLYITAGGYNSLKSYKTSGEKGFSLYFKKINAFSDLKDFNNNYTSILINHYHSSSNYAEYLAFIPSDTSIIMKYNNLGAYKVWQFDNVFTSVEDYNNWVDTLEYDAEKEMYCLNFTGFTFNDISNFYKYNLIGLFNIGKVDFINSDNYDESNLSDYNYVDRGNVYIQINQVERIPYEKEYTAPALGHIWGHNWKLFDENNHNDLPAAITNVETLLMYAENSNDYTLSDLQVPGNIYYELCDRASDAYKIKMEHIHDYGNPEFIWSNDYSSCKAKFVCSINDDTQIVDCIVTPVTTNPTYDTEGKIVYTAKCTFEGREYTDTKEVSIEKLRDNTPPNVSINVLNKTYSELLNIFSFNHYVNTTENVTITAEDINTTDETETPSGIRDIKYYISDIGLTKAQLSALSEDEWIPYNIFTISPNRECFIYAKATDNRGNIGYSSTDGIVLDNIAPTISGIKNDTNYKNDKVTYTIYDKYLESIIIDGRTVPVTNNTVINELINDSIKGNKSHTIIAIDKAGNKSSVTFTFSNKNVAEEDIPDDNPPEEIPTIPDEEIPDDVPDDPVEDVPAAGNNNIKIYLVIDILSMIIIIVTILNKKEKTKQYS